MKRASYRAAVEWIALNDEPSGVQEDFVRWQLTAQLVAELFGVPASRVAVDVLRLRKKYARETERLRLRSLGGAQ